MPQKSNLEKIWDSFWKGATWGAGNYSPPEQVWKSRSNDEKRLADLHRRLLDWTPVELDALAEHTDLPPLTGPLTMLLARLLRNTAIFQDLPPLPPWSIDAYVKHKRILQELADYRSDPEKYLVECGANITNLVRTLWVDVPNDVGHFTFPLYTHLPALEFVRGLFENQRLEPPDAKCTLHEYIQKHCPEPYLEYFLSPVPVPRETFFAHCHIVGGSGAGKTQLLSALFLDFLHDEELPSIVVVDSQGDFIRQLSTLKSDRRVIHISPRYSPGVNVFDVHTGGDEQLAAGAIQTLTYLFTGILGTDLTAKQGIFFRFLCRFMLAFPEVRGEPATLLDMLAALDDISPYRDIVASLPTVQRQFFERDFDGKEFRQTKEQVRYRLNGILENPTLERLFTQKKTQLNLSKELNGSILLIDTDQAYLKEQCGAFGRIFVALVLYAILERATTNDRHPVFMLIDEAHQYFDTNIDDLLTQARKYNLGLTLAHQYMGQCTPALRASLASNTSIKLASQVSSQDAQALAGDMRTTRDFILSQPKLTFAAYVQGMQSAAPYTVTPGLLDREEKGGEPIRLESSPEGRSASNHEQSRKDEENITTEHDPTQFG